MPPLTPPSTLTRTANPLLSPAVAPMAGGVAAAEREMASRPHLKADRRMARRHVLDVRDGRQAKSAAEAMGDLPGPEQAVHVVVSGRFSLWDCVPAILVRTGLPIDRLHIATLGFSRRNIEAMAAALDARQIRSLRLLVSHYFKGTSPHSYAFAVEELSRRPGAEFLSLRTHCKLLLIRMADGTTYTLESSANLRSCKNIEQLSVIGGPALYEFHAGWIDELFEQGKRFVSRGGS